MSGLRFHTGGTVRTPSGVACVRGDIGNRYAVERALGAGSMGVVYLAHDRVLERKVAIKVLRDHLAKDEVYVERMMREARAVAKIKSPHVAAVLDVGTLERGAPYIVMEHLDGMDLAELLSVRGRLEPDEVIAIVTQACGALAEAHPAGIVHRDLKPENLFLARQSDGRVIVKVLDFGIAGEAHRVPGALALTGPNMTLGSPNYMAPEQIEASPDLDARADLWALGAILYEAVAGRAPFEGDVTHQVFHRVLMTEPAPLREARPDVPMAFEAVVLRCLQKDPRARYAGVPHLAQALRALRPAAMELLADDLKTGRRASEPVVVSIAEPRQSTTVELAAIRARPVLPALLATLFGAALAMGAWWSYEAWSERAVPAVSGSRAASRVVPSSGARSSSAGADAHRRILDARSSRSKVPSRGTASTRTSASSASRSSLPSPSSDGAGRMTTSLRKIHAVPKRPAPTLPRSGAHAERRPASRQSVQARLDTRVDIAEFGGRK